jgi:ATP/maltotriose-dependent transcriptional regulator MalT
VSTKLWKLSIEQERGLRQDIQFKDALVNSSFEALILYRSNRIVDCNQAFLDLISLDIDAVRALQVDQLLPLTGDQLARLANNETVPAALRSADAIAVELRRRDMTMANFEYHSLIIRKQDSAEFAVMQKLASPRELDPLIDRLPLSKRERQIVHDITNGFTRTEIADHLFISEETVKKHTANVYLKLRVNSKIELINRIIEQ